MSIKKISHENDKLAKIHLTLYLFMTKKYMFEYNKICCYRLFSFLTPHLKKDYAEELSFTYLIPTAVISIIVVY
ncbi:MAG: hypothetical protein A2Y62_11405 [Candidatus Fischerbacteria bacterium RBG_13_37_8]|uniref:Uncharacterized protein n=1 Tax=Candidatus Fischerbacteria bacterium RBG_13_37_8 TaxID=1817863 RepID=A0A1F5VXY1_9BACT|nr:MAG: hypothetical protein A2Y62_11405 [Candidatus Fischerbacteria bacterium RBG_13_37_8]